MASVDIRGGFGTQLLSMIGALCYYGKENVHEFAINVGGYSPEYRALAAFENHIFHLSSRKQEVFFPDSGLQFQAGQ
ncbi:MAG: hypothetical protein EBU08_08880 [Micrococcales bacterium]|nr:hypothetical protein [Micrococcales bacterium]